MVEKRKREKRKKDFKANVRVKRGRPVLRDVLALESMHHWGHSVNHTRYIIISIVLILTKGEGQDEREGFNGREEKRKTSRLTYGS